MVDKKINKKQDDELMAQLRTIDNYNLAVYFFLPMVFGVVGGRSLAIWCIPIWWLHSWIYIVYFHFYCKKISDPFWRSQLKLSKRYTFHLIAWGWGVFVPLMILWKMVQG